MFDALQREGILRTAELIHMCTMEREVVWIVRVLFYLQTDCISLHDRESLVIFWQIVSLHDREFGSVEIVSLIAVKKRDCIPDQFF